MGNVCVIGIGRVGLPLALMLSESGLKVYGIDINKEYVEKIKAGVLPFMEEGAEEILKRRVNKEFIPATDYSMVEKCDAIILTVGTPIDKDKKPNLTYLFDAIKKIEPYLRKNQLIILRSTISPGTTEKVKNLIEEKTGFKEGKDFFIAHCPERILEGKSLQELKELPQIVGVFNDKAFELSKEVFKFAPLFLKTDPKSAELAKLFSNMYRYITFAIPNEFMRVADSFGADFYEVRKLVNSGYKRGGIGLPGFTAGPCLEKDGFFLINNKYKPELILTSYNIHESLPEYFIQRIDEKFDFNFKNKKVTILGMTFKADIDDTRNSLSFKLKTLLELRGAKVVCHDPYIKEYDRELKEVLKDADVVFIAQPHKQYKELTINKIKELTGKEVIVCDVWDVLKTGRITLNLT